MGALDGRVAIITGSGRGIGREHALLFAHEGAKVVINDLGGAIDGSGDDRTPAQQVVDEIKAMGGEAVANADNVADCEGGQRLIQPAIDTFGDLHILVNNAGILRDRVLVNMTEDEWDAVIHVHLKGHFVPTRFAAAYWLVAAMERERYGGRVSAIAPAARTRMTEATPGLDQIVKAPEDAAKFDIWDPANVSPMVAYLATESLPFTGRVFFVQGGKVQNMTPWQMAEAIDKDDRWTVGELENEVKKLLG